MKYLNFFPVNQFKSKICFVWGNMFNQLYTSSSHPRPILIKLCTAWDRKLVLLRKASLREFRIKRLFLREDVSPDHKLRSRKPSPSVESYSGNSSQAHPVSHSSPSSEAQSLSYTSGDSAPLNRGPLSSATCDTSSKSVSTTPVRAVSQPPSSSSPISAAVNGIHTLTHFIDSLDLCFVQEHWLLSDQLHQINNVSPDFFYL